MGRLAGVGSWTAGKRSAARGCAVAALLCCAVAPARAGGPHALLVEDANSGAVLINQDGDEPRHPASLTKMMTLYLTFEAIEQGRLTMQSRVKISERAANAAPSKLELPAGEDIALEDAILALITKSANDVAIAIAEQIGGSEAHFAELMTAKARDIGMKNTTFKNASGLPDNAQITTARDMVTLGLRLYDDHPRYFALFATKSFSYNGATYKNHNTLMLQMPGINGIKTGYTHGSGFNLVTSYAADGKHLVGAIFGGETATLRNVSMRVALSKAMTRASSVKTRKPVLVAQAKKKTVPAPMPVARKPAPAAAAPVIAAEAAPATEVIAAQPAAVPLKIEVARVRSVAIVPARQVEPANAAPALAPAPPPAAVTIAAEPAPVRAPTAFATHMAQLARNMVAASASAASASLVPEGAAPAVTATGVRAPSTLNAQMASLSAGGAPASGKLPPPVYRLKGPAPDDAVAVPSGGFEIQIGAFGSAGEAEKGLAAAAAKFAAALGGHPASHQSVNANGRMLYRARFGGFDAAAAAHACEALKQGNGSCFVIKAE